MKLLNTLKNFPSAQKFLWFSLFFLFLNVSFKNDTCIMV